MGKFQCFFSHDWEYVESIYIEQLEENINAMNEGRFPSSIDIGFSKRVCKKVCLKCGVKVDTLTPKIAELNEQFHNRSLRQKTAKELMK